MSYNFLIILVAILSFVLALSLVKVYHNYKEAKRFYMGCKVYEELLAFMHEDGVDILSYIQALKQKEKEVK